MICLIVLVGSALAAKPLLPEDQIGLIPVSDAYFEKYIDQCLKAGEYETKLVAGCDPNDPVYEVDYSRPIKLSSLKLSPQDKVARTLP